MEFLIAWNEEDLIRLFEDYSVLRRKNTTLISKLKPTPSVGILCPREDLEAVIMERIKETGFMPADGASIVWRSRKGLSAQIKVVGDPDAISAPVAHVLASSQDAPSPDAEPVPPVALDPSLFPPGADLTGLQNAAQDDLLRHPITGKVVGTTKDRTQMVGETPAEETKPNAKKKSPVSRRKRRKKP